MKSPLLKSVYAAALGLGLAIPSYAQRIEIQSSGDPQLGTNSVVVGHQLGASDSVEGMDSAWQAPARDLSMKLYSRSLGEGAPLERDYRSLTSQKMFRIPLSIVSSNNENPHFLTQTNRVRFRFPDYVGTNSLPADARNYFVHLHRHGAYTTGTVEDQVTVTNLVDLIASGQELEDGTYAGFINGDLIHSLPSDGEYGYIDLTCMPRTNFVRGLRGQRIGTDLSTNLFTGLEHRIGQVPTNSILYDGLIQVLANGTTVNPSVEYDTTDLAPTNDFMRHEIYWNGVKLGEETISFRARDSLVNTPPSASNVSKDIGRGLASIDPLIGNDVDVGDTLEFVPVSPTASSEFGTFLLDGTNMNYLAPQSAIGPFSFQYRIRDSEGGESDIITATYVTTNAPVRFISSLAPLVLSSGGTRALNSLDSLVEDLDDSLGNLTFSFSSDLPGDTIRSDTNTLSFRSWTNSYTFDPLTLQSKTNTYSLSVTDGFSTNTVPVEVFIERPGRIITEETQPPVIEVSPDSTNAVLQTTAPSGVIYSYEYSTNLVDWLPYNLPPNIVPFTPSGVGTTSDTINATNQVPYFFRVKIE